MLTCRRLLPVLGALIPLLLLSCDSEEEQAGDALPSPQDTATSSADPTTAPSVTISSSPVPVPVGYTKYRWGNLTVVVPDGVVTVSRRVASPGENPPDGGLVLTLRQGEASIKLDADDARVIVETDSKGAELAEAVNTIRVDEEPGDAEPWPLGEQVPLGEKLESASIRYWEPDPASGIVQFIVCPDAAVGESDGSCAIGITNGYSRWSIYANGQNGHDTVRDRDQAAFDRWIASIERVTD